MTAIEQGEPVTVRAVHSAPQCALSLLVLCFPTLASERPRHQSADGFGTRRLVRLFQVMPLSIATLSRRQL